jgi:rhodanese-related sulfurtransferase
MQQISAEQFLHILDTMITVIDVRTPEEYLRGHIHRSVSIPLDTFESKIEKLISSKSDPIYVYCFSGSRSTIAAQLLKDLGYKEVFELRNGLLSWRAKGYPLEK